MKRNILFLVVLPLLLYSCKEDKKQGYMTNQKALDYFEKVDSICKEDKAMLWGENLYGPLMMIDPVTRQIFSNTQDASGLLKERDGIFTGTYPKEMIINTIAVNYGETLYGMLRLRDEEDSKQIITGCLHALFHRFQVIKRIDTPGSHNSHLKERTARLWVKMEWKALQRAIRTSGETRKQAVRDALVFRSARREMYPRFIKEENMFENYEGLTSFTYLYLTSNDHDAYVRELLNFYNRIYNTRSYMYSWGFINGALYTHLIFEKGYDLRNINSRDIDLGELTRDLYDIELPDISRDIAGSLAFSYDIDLVKQEENQREETLKQGLWKRVSKFIDRPVVFVELQSPNFSFDPEDMDPVDTLGTIYTKLRVSDNWGKISVDEVGCLVSPNLDFIRLPARNINTDRNHISGEGWHIILNDNWEMIEYEQNYIIRKLVP